MGSCFSSTSGDRSEEEKDEWLSGGKQLKAPLRAGATGTSLVPPAAPPAEAAAAPLVVSDLGASRLMKSNNHYKETNAQLMETNHVLVNINEVLETKARKLEQLVRVKDKMLQQLRAKLEPEDVPEPPAKLVKQ